MSDSALQIHDGTASSGLVALSLAETEDVGEVHGTKGRLRSLTHGSVDRVVRVGVKSESIGITASRLVSLVESTLQFLVHESRFGRKNIRVAPHDQVLLPRFRAVDLRVVHVPCAKVVMRCLNVVVIPVDREGALKKRRLAILANQSACPTNLLPSVLLLAQPLHERLALEDLVLHPVRLLGMPYATVGREVCDHGILAENVMVGFEAELDVQLISDVEGEVEVRQGVYAMIGGVDGGVVYFGEG